MKRKFASPTKEPSEKVLKKDEKPKSFEKKSKPPKKNPSALTQKPEDWTEFKKNKKELRQKRRQNKSGSDVIQQAKRIGEKLRCRKLAGGPVERNKLINELHSMLKGQGHYPKFVLAHDTSRIVQWLLKYSSDFVREQISKELISVTLEMLQSKYGIFCVKRLLKYGNQDTKSAIVNAMYGNAIKLTSHSLSASVFEFAYTNCASNIQKQHLIQEFFGEMYRKSKDNSVKHLRDTYQDPSLKPATLGATKANLLRVINKNLLDSTLVQSVLHQFLSECDKVDKAELISELIRHIVVVSNSRDGSRVAMQCIWNGSNKDRKLAMKTIKEHVVELSKHEHGHSTIITLLDAADDTVLLHKIIIGEILKNAKDLAVSEWGRKVLLWLVAPGDLTCFHPVFVKELEEGRKDSTSKKEADIRRTEILSSSIETLTKLIVEDPQFWLKNSSLGYELQTILKAGKGDLLREAYESVAKVITDKNWKIKIKEEEVFGIEDAGFHMILKKIIRNDPSFGECIAELLTNDTIKDWLDLNRGCFFLVAIYENGSKETQRKLSKKLKKHIETLKKQTTTGGKILLKKITE